MLGASVVAGHAELLLSDVCNEDGEAVCFGGGLAAPHTPGRYLKHVRDYLILET